ncbi:hypothetical protein HDK90DRAFT_201818 [Phyllosticta capitalensis]|uniref:Uncharacterized protein n=1 Tax=Phyllosticta capitalensis TaxID=121624 RepID=A0ABR1YRT7_9PEZI
MTRKPKHPRNFCAAHPSQVSLLQDTDEPKGLKGRGKEKRAVAELQPIPTSRPDFKNDPDARPLRKTMVLWYFTFGVTTTAGGMCCAARLRLRVDWLACWLSAVLAAVTTLSCLISPPQTARRSGGHRAPFCESLFAHSKR